MIYSQQKNAKIFTDKPENISNKQTLKFSDNHLLDLITSNLGILFKKVFKNHYLNLQNPNTFQRIFHKILFYTLFIQTIYLLQKVKFKCKNLKVFHYNSNFVRQIIPVFSIKYLIKVQFQLENEQSLVNLIQKSYKNKLAYLFTSNQKLIKEYQNNIIYTEANAFGVKLKQTNSNFSVSVNKSLLNCATDGLQKKFIFEEDRFSSSMSQSIQITDLGAYTELLKDICGVLQISQYIREEGKEPNIFVFHLESFYKFEKSINKEQTIILEELLHLMIDQFSQNISRHFQPDEVSGQVILIPHIQKYTQDPQKNDQNLQKNQDQKLGSETQQLNQKNQNKMNTTQFKQIQTNSSHLHASNVTQNIHKQAQIVTIVVFTFLIIALFYQMVNMEYKRDPIVFYKILNFENS